MNILIVEDELKIGESLRLGLTEAGYIVDLIHDGTQGQRVAMTRAHDLIILDIMLPGIDGRQILQNLRNSGNHVPVLFLTARDSIQDRVQGLELGADDYLVKPFAFPELLARVRTLLRRDRAETKSQLLTISDLQLDLTAHQVTRGGNKIKLTAKEFSLLALLMRRRGEALPRSLIASLVWDIHFDSDTNIIDVAIRRLRSKIDDGFDIKLIHTVRGMGYLLDLPDQL